MTSQSSSSVRVRYAPSPTGYLHVGGARTLLFNYLYAKKYGGILVLRIEDTDQARSTREHEKMILSDVQRLGLNYQEGPDAGGSVGPYRQSERLSIYAQRARELFDRDQAYYCFCSDSLLTQKRELAMKLGKSPHYDGTCARISKDEALKRLKAGEKAGLRFRAYQKDMVLQDEVRGRVEFKAGSVGDFLITRTPSSGEEEIAEGIGMPVYNFCCVIDDNAMGMTHIIRGEDHLSNTARQLMIYEAFGWKTPVFAHTAMVLGSDRQKLSKRNGDTSVFEYLDSGYMPEALLNFLVLLGWWPPNDFKPSSGHPEILSVDELAQCFNLDGLQKAPAVFDVQKLQWMNGQYIKHLPLDEIVKRAKPFFVKAGIEVDKYPADWFAQVVDLYRVEVSLLKDLPKAAALFFDASVTLETAAQDWLKSEKSQPIPGLISGFLESSSASLTADDVATMQKMVAEKAGVKGKELFMPVRALTTGMAHGPELKKVLPLLGRDRVLRHVQEIRRQAGV